MADVRLSIAGREYIVTCNDGEEQRLQALGALVDEKAREAGGPTGGLNESRLLLFSALLLADKLHDGGAACFVRHRANRSRQKSNKPPKRSNGLPTGWKLWR